ncbi:MAG: nuclear transport factor 2 family protein [Desulfurellaceae bacterium]|nr:nuclear transport factor 2 family protein [Desulfurellaceae bacterium]
MENEWMEKLAIQELFARYAHAIDDLNPEAWVECFTPDGIFQVGTRAMRGQTALRGYADVHIEEIRCRHMMTNFLYEVNGDEATGQCSMLATLATAGGYKIFAQGRYVDRLVKHEGAWRIAHRKVETDQLASNPTGITSIADSDVAALVQPLVDAARKLGDRVQV